MNDRQYKVTKKQLDRLQRAVEEYDLGKEAAQTGSTVLASAALRALESEVEVLVGQIAEYQLLRSGSVAEVCATSLEELPTTLVRARIAKRLTQRELAERLGLKEQQIQRYESTEYSGASFRRLLEVAKALSIDVCNADEPQRPSAPMEESRELDWGRFPVREMYRRKWFEGFEGSLDAALRAPDVVVRDFIQGAVRTPALALHRMHVRSGTQLDEYALLAWECRVLDLASKVPLAASFEDARVDLGWVTTKLLPLTRRADGPIRARDELAGAGIVLVVEPHMANTYLDGASLLHGSSPVIGMTLRYDRLDNFWFVLFHELVHVIKHLRKGGYDSVFDDLDTEGRSDVEREADVLAAEALIPSDAWERALARYVRSRASVETFADERGIGPSIVAGRIRHEARNFVLLSELVGQGEVRRLFPEVGFGV